MDRRRESDDSILPNPMLGTILIMHPGAPGTKAPPGPHNVHGGNVSTALRWAAIFEKLGWSVRTSSSWEGEPFDLLVALHARKSHESIMRFHAAHPQTPIVVAATGTDIYGDAQPGDEVHESFEVAARIVVLQPLAVDALPETARGKARVIYQSMPRAVRRKSVSWNSGSPFDVAFLANARPVKDPLTALQAARQLAPDSRVRILHLGGVLDEALGARLCTDGADCPAFFSLGELPRGAALDMLDRSHLALSTSKHEGGANVVTEALALDVPVIATDIPGSVGLLGAGYPGLFPVGDARGLAKLLERAATDEAFYTSLRDACREQASITDPQRESDAWASLLGEL